MKHRSARILVCSITAVPFLALAVVPAATASSGAARDGVCPPTFVLTPADSELRRQIDATTGSIDGFVCAMELNVHAPHPRTLVDNMAR
jgi:hypothetical protein